MPDEAAQKKIRAILDGWIAKGYSPRLVAFDRLEGCRVCGEQTGDFQVSMVGVTNDKRKLYLYAFVTLCALRCVDSKDAKRKTIDLVIDRFEAGESGER